MLQTLREGPGAMLTPFFIAMSEYVIAAGPIMLAFVYWCVDKRIGAWGFFNLTLSGLATSVVKLTTCVYRPWILDGRLHIDPRVASSATGYSFPSTHTTMASSTFGSIAWWQRRRRAWFAVVLVIVTLLIGFARNWLGAHTLLDVCAALCVAAVVMVITSLVMRYLDANPSKDVMIVLLVLATCAVAAIYVMVKPYPMDYTPTGALLVDPKDMTPDFWEFVGLTSAWAISWLIERRFVGFDCNGTKARKAIRFIAGTALVGVTYVLVMPAVVAPLDPSVGRLIQRFVTILVFGCVFPAIVKFVQVRWPSRSGASE